MGNADLSLMEALQRAYERLLDAQRFDPRELDYSVLERHVARLKLLAQVANSGITVFDMYRRRHDFAELFRYDLEGIAAEDSAYFSRRIHPDDLKPPTATASPACATLWRIANWRRT